MRKFLLSTSALVGVGMVAAPAGAAEPIKLSLGGYMEQYIGFVSQDDDPIVGGTTSSGRNYGSFDTQSDTEIYFSGSTTLDNGIKIGVRVELEADPHNASSANHIDEQWLDVASPTLGNLRLGGDDTVNALAYVSPWRGISGDFDNWISPDNITKNDNAYDHNLSSDVNKVSYFTPRIFGFQLGGSYVPEPGNSGNTTPNYRSDAHSAYSLSLTYSETLMGVKVDAQAANYIEGHTAGTATTSSEGRRSYNYGLKLGYMNWEVGVAYGETNQRVRAQQSTATSVSLDGNHWEAGLAYRPGPWAVGFWYMRDNREGLTAAPADNRDANDTTNVYSLFGEYVLGPGVKLEGMIVKVDYDEETQLDANENSGGWAVVAGFRLDF